MKIKKCLNTSKSKSITKHKERSKIRTMKKRRMSMEATITTLTRRMINSDKVIPSSMNTEYIATKKNIRNQFL